MKKELKWPQDFLNIKCVIFTFYIAISYWFFFKKNTTLKGYLIFGIMNFLLINWYNYNYQCYYNSFWLNSALGIGISSNFYYLPKKDKVVLAFLLYIPYFLLAWYDYFANCKFRMNPTIFPFGRFIFLPMKPPGYQRTYDELDPVVKENIANFDKYIAVSIVWLIFVYFVFKFVK